MVEYILEYYRKIRLFMELLIYLIIKISTYLATNKF